MKRNSVRTLVHRVRKALRRRSDWYDIKTGPTHLFHEATVAFMIRFPFLYAAPLQSRVEHCSSFNSSIIVS
jgi:hypothetical protein